MIALTRLDGELFYLNEDLIERVGPNADTTIFTVAGNVYTVSEPPEDVANAVRFEKALILNLSFHPSPVRRLTVVPDDTEEGR